MSLRGIVVPFVLDGALNRLGFESYVTSVLVPELRSGDILTMDDLPPFALPLHEASLAEPLAGSAHKGPRVAALIQATGATLLHLPPYSPNSNPIENAVANLKALLRIAAESTVSGLWAAIRTSSISSRKPNAPPWSPPQAMPQSEGKLLSLHIEEKD